MKTKSALFAMALLSVTVAAVPAGVADGFHFALRSSVPAADSSVPAPAELLLTFTQVPQDNSVAVRLVSPAGQALETGEPAYDEENRTVVHVAVEQALPAGGYTVAWRGIGDDGHVVRGEFGFTVAADR